MAIKCTPSSQALACQKWWRKAIFLVEKIGEKIGKLERELVRERERWRENKDPKESNFFFFS